MRWRTIKLGLCAFAALIAASVAAYDIPTDRVWGGVTGLGMPSYFSGTNSRVSITVGITYDSVKQVKMWIGGELVWDESYPDPNVSGVWYLSAGHSVMFDSTRFPNGSNLEVKFEMWGWGGSHRIKSEFATVKNQFDAWNHPDLSDGALVAETYLDNMGYVGYATIGNSWTNNDLLTSLAGKNICYVASHGERNMHSAGDNSGVLGYHAILPNYDAYRITQMGIGYPPFNSTGNPPIAFLHLYACNCGDDGSFQTSLYPGYNAYAGLYEDQAVLSYSVYVPVDQADDHAEIVFPTLSEGWTLAAARVELATTSGLTAWDEVEPEPPYGPTRDLVLGDIMIYGDPAMRLSSVYTGTNVAPVGWYRHL